jgi:hypothetical protein
MLFSHGIGQQRIDDKKNADKLLAISMAMAMQRYDARRIARWSTFRASLEAVLPRRPPWLTISNKTHNTLPKHNF